MTIRYVIPKSADTLGGCGTINPITSSLKRLLMLGIIYYFTISPFKQTCPNVLKVHQEISIHFCTCLQIMSSYVGSLIRFVTLSIESYASHEFICSRLSDVLLKGYLFLNCGSNSSRI